MTSSRDLTDRSRRTWATCVHDASKASPLRYRGHSATLNFPDGCAASGVRAAVEGYAHFVRDTSPLEYQTLDWSRCRSVLFRVRWRRLTRLLKERFAALPIEGPYEIDGVKYLPFEPEIWDDS